MDQLIERSCGLDVHRDTVAACVRVPGPKDKRQHEVRTFGTTAVESLALRDWLEGHAVTHIAMESTGVLLEARVLRARGGSDPLPECAPATDRGFSEQTLPVLWTGRRYFGVSVTSPAALSILTLN